uniref:DH domain-containing protein n=1 Tax=Panagrolaimus superbus TaxID=310955 RepID=A0A914Z6U3_9BILA
MERTVTEIGKAEDLFFKKLHLIAIDFPKYINDRQVSHNGVITEIAKDLVPIVGPHEMFLNDLAKISPFWDSRFPNLADVILIHIKDFGKCLPFLKHIETHRQKFKQMLCDETFAAATAQFEKEIMNQRSVFICNTFDNLLKPVFQNPNNTGITVYEQLDSIFQNLLRYKLLLQRYQSSLDPRSESEIYLTKEAVEKLDDIVEDISCELTAPKLAEICKNISEKLKNFDFDALKPGRYLVKEGEVLKQCRRKMDKRH